MVKRWFTGLKELDQMLGKGVQAGDVVLFLYEIGSCYNFLISEIIRNHHKEKGKILLTLTSTSSPQFITQIQDIVSQENFIIVDCISPKNIYNAKHYIPNPSQTFDILLEMKKARDGLLENSKEDEPPPLVCFHSLDSLFINFETNEVIQFLNKNIGEAAKSKTIEFYLLPEGILEKDVEKRVQTLANVVIKTRTEFRGHRRQNYLQLLEHSSETPYPEEKQFSIVGRDPAKPEIIFHIPLFGSFSERERNQF
jgi:archaellum biogenesis ATPase FlaH